MLWSLVSRDGSSCPQASTWFQALVITGDGTMGLVGQV